MFASLLGDEMDGDGTGRWCQKIMLVRSSFNGVPTAQVHHPESVANQACLPEDDLVRHRCRTLRQDQGTDTARSQ